MRCKITPCKDCDGYSEVTMCVYNDITMIMSPMGLTHGTARVVTLQNGLLNNKLILYLVLLEEFVSIKPLGPMCIIKMFITKVFLMKFFFLKVFFLRETCFFLYNALISYSCFVYLLPLVFPTLSAWIEHPDSLASLYLVLVLRVVITIYNKVIGADFFSS